MYRIEQLGWQISICLVLVSVLVSVYIVIFFEVYSTPSFFTIEFLSTLELIVHVLILIRLWIIWPYIYHLLFSFFRLLKSFSSINFQFFIGFLDLLFSSLLITVFFVYLFFFIWSMEKSCCFFFVFT